MRMSRWAPAQAPPAISTSSAQASRMVPPGSRHSARMAAGWPASAAMKVSSPARSDSAAVAEAAVPALTAGLAAPRDGRSGAMADLVFGELGLVDLVGAIAKAQDAGVAPH